MEEFINKIMEQIKDNLVDGVEPKYHDELLKGYEYSLQRQFDGIEVKEEKLDEFLKNEINKRNTMIKKYAPWTRLSLYIPDESLEKLASLSQEGFNLGLRRLNEGTLANILLVERNKYKMKALLERVREFNVLSAHQLYNDGILDYDFSCGKSDAYSLRLGHSIINNNREEGEER